jgi:hypothetical protein
MADLAALAAAALQVVLRVAEGAGRDGADLGEEMVLQLLKCRTSSHAAESHSVHQE